MNNFKNLEEILSKDKDFTIQKVRNNLVHTRGVFSFIGDLVEMFLPRLAEVITGMAGGSEDGSKKKYPHEGGLK